MAKLEEFVLPNLLIIGAAKCGTTSLHNYLDAHPDVVMSKEKEIDFFSGTRWENGLQWYSQHFDPTAPKRGESSTSYTRDRNAPKVAERIRTAAPDAKLIYMVRDPIDRVRSDYLHYSARGNETRKLSEALADPENPYVQASRYFTELLPYVERFGIDRILVQTQEQLLHDRAGSLSRVFEFIGVDSSFYAHEFDRLWERSEGKGWAYSLALRVRSAGVRLPPVLRWPAQKIQRSHILGGGRASAKPPDLDGALRRTLTETLQPEVDGLRRLTGDSYEDWSM